MLADESYVSWFKNQAGMKEKYPTVYNVIVMGNSRGKDEPTPEHNKPQNLFLKDKFCVCLAAFFMGSAEKVNAEFKVKCQELFSKEFPTRKDTYTEEDISEKAKEEAKKVAKETDEWEVREREATRITIRKILKKKLKDREKLIAG